MINIPLMARTEFTGNITDFTSTKSENDIWCDFSGGILLEFI